MTKPRIAKHSGSPQIADSASCDNSDRAASEIRDEKLVDAKIKAETNRVLENIALQTERPGTAFWLSFADEGFRGAVIVHANEFFEAVMQANLHGINPGGQCAGREIPPDMAALVPEAWKYRLLSREDCGKFDEEMDEILDAAEN